MKQAHESAAQFTNCNKQIQERGLSTKACTLEVKSKLIPDCDKELLKEAGKDKDHMPTHNEILIVCDLESVLIPTVWCWMHVWVTNVLKTKGATTQMGTREKTQ